MIATFGGDAPFAPTTSPVLVQAAKQARGRIAFICNSAVCTMDADGSELEHLTTPVNAIDTIPLTFSPDGQKIAFARYDILHFLPQIWVVNADGAKPTNLTPDAEYSDAYAWSPDGTRIAYVSDAQLYVVNVDGTGLRQLTRSPNFADAPTWSCSGGTIAFVNTRKSKNGGGLSRGQICTINVQGTAFRNISNGPYVDLEPKFSPDGTKLTFTRYPISCSGWKGDVCVMNADGSDAVNLTNSLDARTGSWSPDSRKIAFTRKHEQSIDVYVVTIGDDAAIRRITRGANVYGVPSWFADGTALTFGSDFDIFVINADGTGMSNITNNRAGNNACPVRSP